MVNEPVLGVWGPLALLEKIGEGSGGEVFRAFDPSLQREVALKILRAPAGVESHMLEEARRLAGVRHPNVLVVHGVELRNGAIGIWTDLIKGRTLEDSLDQQGPLGASEARLIGIELCRALAAVHAAGLVHRDLKTSNVMREQGGRLVLMDFGSVGESPGPARPALDDDLVGTPAVMAPEQLFGKPVGPTADIYALGVLLYRLTTGHYPIEADSVAELIEKHRQGAAVALRDRRPDLPTDFVQVIDKAMAADPGDRYPSAGAMERALVAALGGHPPGYRERAVELQVGKWFRFRFATVTVAALAVASALTLTLMRRSERPILSPPPTAPPAVTRPENQPLPTGGAGGPAAVEPEVLLPPAVGFEWRVRVVAPFHAKLAGRYPLSPDGPEVPLAAFAEFFKPGGTFWHFYDETLKPYVAEDGTPVPGAERVVSSELRRTVRSARDIRDAFFAMGAEPALHFMVRSEPPWPVHTTPGYTLDWIDFELGGQPPTHYTMGAPTWTALTWPGPRPSAGAAVRAGGNNLTLESHETGVWGLFRLLDKGRFSGSESAPQVDVQVSVGAETWSLPLEFKLEAERPNHPFRRNFLRFWLPSRI